MDARTRTQIFRFLVVGVTATVADASVYFGLIDTGVADALHSALPDALHALVPGAHDVGKSCSFLFGTLVSYVLNKRWTFESKEADPRQTAAFVALYASTFLLNVAVNHSVLALDPPEGVPRRAVELTAFLVATACSTVANFFGQKFWVFKSAGPPHASG